MRKILLSVLLALATMTTVSAQKFMEFGLTAGVNMPNYSTSMDYASMKNKLGWQAGVTLRINTPIIAIQPELLYVRQGLNINGLTEDIRVKSNTLSMPILASLKLFKILRINAGPVLSLVNDCKFKYAGENVSLGRMQPTVGYAVGAAVKLSHMVIDARFNGQFKNKRIEPSIAGLDFDIKSYSVALSVAYVF